MKCPKIIAISTSVISRRRWTRILSCSRIVLGRFRPKEAPVITENVFFFLALSAFLFECDEEKKSTRILLRFIFYKKEKNITPISGEDNLTTLWERFVFKLNQTIALKKKLRKKLSYLNLHLRPCRFFFRKEFQQSPAISLSRCFSSRKAV